MGHRNRDRDCEPTQLTVVTRMGAFLPRTERRNPAIVAPWRGFAISEPITAADVLYGAANCTPRNRARGEHLAVERKGGGYFITLLSGGVGSGGVDDVALGKHGLRNALA